MAQAMYAVVNNSNRRIKTGYCVVGGTTKKIKAMYAVIDGKTKLVWSINSFPFTGIAYGFGDNKSSKKFGVRTWDGELFSGVKSATTFSSNTSNYSGGVAFSKNGTLAVTKTFESMNPTLTFYKWEQKNQTYTKIYSTGVGNLFSISPSGYWQCYLSETSWIKSDGTQVIVAAHFTADSSSYYNSSYKSSFDSYKNSPSTYLLFFDVNLNNNTATFSKGVFLQQNYSYPTSSSQTFYTLNDVNFSDSDDYVIVSIGKELMYESDGSSWPYATQSIIHKIDTGAKTSSAFSLPDQLIKVTSMSNCGHYAFINVYTPSESGSGSNITYKIYYLSNNTITATNNLIGSDSYGNVGALIPDCVYTLPDKNILYLIYRDSLFTYSTNGITLTRLGSLSLQIFYYSTKCTIHDINEAFILMGGLTDSDGLTNSQSYQTVCGVIQKDSSNIITAVSPVWSVYNYSASYKYINGARLVDKLNLVEGNLGKTVVNFTSSTSWKVPAGVTSIDIMCIGGGGGAGGSYYEFKYYDADDDGEAESYSASSSSGPSGAGGYTSVVKNIPVTPGETLSITVGAGGAGGKGRYYYLDSDGSVESNGIYSTSSGGTGGASYVTRSGTRLCTASGGNGGKNKTSSTIVATRGASGGSGSGATAGSGWGDSSSGVSVGSGRDGIDGNGGGSSDNSIYLSPVAGGSGQGSTTREWGSPLGTLYSSAGGNSSIAPTQNTGHGGKRGTLSKNISNQMSGSSGKVIIRY